MFKKAMIAGAVLAGAFAAQAQVGTPSPSGTLTVTGTIPAPVCTLTLASNGTVPFGTLTRATVQAWSAGTAPARYNAPTAQQKTLALTVNCPAPTKMALAFSDQRSTSLDSAYPANAFGLGTYAPAGGGTAEKIGGFLVNYSALQITPTVGGTAAAPTVRLVTPGSATSASVWATATGLDASYLPNARSLGFAATAGATTPDSLVSIAGNLRIAPELIKSVVDSATGDITLDGSATITLVGV